MITVTIIIVSLIIVVTVTILGLVINCRCWRASRIFVSLVMSLTWTRGACGARASFFHPFHFVLVGGIIHVYVIELQRIINLIVFIMVLRAFKF